MGPPDTFPPKEGMLLIFIALKNPSPSGLNLRTLGLIVSTLTIAPPRTAIEKRMFYRCEQLYSFLKNVN
jgi:hypothetical protein